MIELINIFTCLIVFLCLSFFPIRINIVKKNKALVYDNLFDNLSLNLTLNLLFIFFISFLNISFLIYFVFLIFLIISFNVIWFLNNKKYYTNVKNKNFIFFILINIIIFIFLARDPTLSWDGLENWYYKAQNFYYGFNFFDLKDIKGHSYYPHFGSMMWGFFWKNTFIQYEYFGRFIFAFIYLLSIFSICELIDKKNSIKYIILSLLILLCFDDFLFKGYQEILLFSFLILLSKNFYFFIQLNKKKYLLISFIYLNLLPWVKNEGYLFSLIFCSSLIIMIKSFKNKFSIIIFVLFSLILIIFKNYIFLEYLNLNLTHSGNLKLFKEFYVIKDFVVIFGYGLLVAIIKYKVWLFIIISLFFFSKSKKVTNNDKKFLIFSKINFTLYISLMVIIYYTRIGNDISNLDWWIDNSLDRLIYSVSGFFIILIVLLTKYYKDYNLK